MPETLETLANRLDRLEVAMQQIANQLSRISDESAPHLKEKKKFKTGAEAIADLAIDKRPLAAGFRKLMERMGIPEQPTISIEELQERMACNGIRPEDNEFSRAIIEEREN
jgi:hypothetical protein